MYQLCLIFEESFDIQYKEWMLKGEGETAVLVGSKLSDTVCLVSREMFFFVLYDRQSKKVKLNFSVIARC